MRLFRRSFMAAALIAALGIAPQAVSAPAKKPDLADTAQGHYSGDIISDARGSSRSGIDITVTKIGKNKVRVEADHDRIPTREFALTKAMDTIQNVGGTEVFLLELAKSPKQLSLTIDDASWSGEYEGALEPAGGDHAGHEMKQGGK